MRNEIGYGEFASQFTTPTTAETLILFGFCFLDPVNPINLGRDRLRFNTFHVSPRTIVTLEREWGGGKNGEYEGRRRRCFDEEAVERPGGWSSRPRRPLHARSARVSARLLQWLPIAG